MITECPNCHKRFLVMEDLFESAQGTVRCGACMKTFKVFDHLCEYSDSQAGLLVEPATNTAGNAAPGNHATGSAATGKNRLAALQQHSATAKQATPTAGQDTAAGPTVSALERQREDGRVEPVVPGVIPGKTGPISMQNLSAQLRPDPVEMSTRQHRPSHLGSTLRTLPIVLLAGVLGWALYLQWFDVRAGELPQNVVVQAAYRHLCSLLHCGEAINKSNYVSRKLIVYSHPEREDALVVETVILNIGSRALPFPALNLEFRDLQGAAVARQQFKPREYLSGELAGAQTLEPDSPVKVQLEIVDPGPHAVNYSLDMLAIN